MGRGEERGHLQRPGRFGGHPVSQPDLFVLRFAYDLQAAGSRRVLDAGCGTGRNADYLAGLGFQVVALDSAANKVHEARVKSSRQDAIAFLAGRLESLPFASGSFDAVICTHVMEYLDASAIDAALQEFRRVLRRGGLLLLVTAAKEGANLEAAEDLGGNRFLFKRGPVEIVVHLAGEAELERWLEGFTVREMFRLAIEYPKPATIDADWAVIAKSMA